MKWRNGFGEQPPGDKRPVNKQAGEVIREMRIDMMEWCRRAARWGQATCEQASWQGGSGNAT
eukprot:11616857-Alexandrium_andersonii.AAC.1